MFFFNDECDLNDEDQYDFFTLATVVQHRLGSLPQFRSRLRRDSVTPAKQQPRSSAVKSKA
jgi:hypothetical protein